MSQRSHMQHLTSQHYHRPDPPKEAAITQPNSTTSTWTDERIERLKALHSNGISFARIAAIIGGVSRNAVIGKAGRLGLVHRGKGYQGAAPRVVKERPLRLVVINKPKPVPVMQCVEMPSLKLTFSDLQAGDCRYPEGDDPASMTFCGHPSIEGFSYCWFHKERCWTKPKPISRPSMRVWA